MRGRAASEPWRASRGRRPARRQGPGDDRTYDPTVDLLDARDLDEGALTALYAADERPAPPGRPWVVAGMVSSADGASALDGTSGGLGNRTDRLVLRAVRAIADVILVGAATVRAERYGVPGRRPEQPAGPDPGGSGSGRGLGDRPRLAIVTASCDLPASLPCFGDPHHRPLVLTGRADPVGGGEPGTARCAVLEDHAEVVRVGATPRPDVRAVIGALGDRGARVVVCEGGPSLLGQLVAADLVDELCLTVAPLLVGGEARRIAAGPEVAPPVALALTRVLESEGYLFLRYARPVGPSGPPAAS